MKLLERSRTEAALLPKVGITRASKNPGFAIAASEARVWGLGGQNVLESLTDEAMTTCDENDVGHDVKVWAGERWEKNRRGKGDGKGFMGVQFLHGRATSWHIIL